MGGTRRSLSNRIATVVSVILLAIGAYFVFFTLSWNRKFERWLVEEPVRLRLDLSYSGTFKAPFRQTCAIAHAQSIELVPVYFEDLERVHQVSKRATIDIRVVEVGTTRDVAVLEDATGHPPREAMVRYARLRPLPNGDYTLTAVVRRARELEPMPVYMVVRNDLCGCERLPAIASQVAAGVALFFSVIAGLVAWTDPIRRVDHTGGATPSPPP